MKKLLTILLVSVLATTSWAQDDYYEETNNPDRTVTEDKVANEKPISVTPSFDLLSFPHPGDGALEVVFSKRLGIKYRKSSRPEFKVEGSTAKLDNQSIGVRSYSDQSAFFWGLAYGKHKVDANRYEQINGFDTNVYAHAEAEYITPSFGWKNVYESGFTIGLEFGWLFPYNGSASVSSNQDLNPFVAGTNEYQRKREEAEDAARKYTNKGLPHIGLLEIGWTF